MSDAELAKQTAAIVAARGGANVALEMQEARWDQWRSVRIVIGGKSIGLATAAYSYSLTYDERPQVARRIAALWNLAAIHQWTTEEIEAALTSIDDDHSKLSNRVTT